MRGEVCFIGKVTRVEEDLSTIEVLPEYRDGLYRLSEHKHIVVLYWFHLRDDKKHRGTLQVVPRRHGETELRGVFASHSPSRPNPIGLTEVELLSVEGCTLTVRGLDALVDSPIVDIKPVSKGEDR
ncbi:tRNA (N6-threonylcarbamoyladenosine(37)-N6)-methyltransferase TrmO [Candidatus Bathyarchaeota archaeon RBG_13_60_20]|nr:MAG: tRNA (N6-threonylcarbamoyladenosine(37)-N6)-methyltransferase TrmO [Candidatus Bathyarchaeota archaeon RBG_13_60_20]